MTCPKCGGVAGVRDSKPGKGEIHRQRVCKSCKHIFFTVETVTEDHTGFYQAQHDYYHGIYERKKKRIR